MRSARSRKPAAASLLCSLAAGRTGFAGRGREGGQGGGRLCFFLLRLLRLAIAVLFASCHDFGPFLPVGRRVRPAPFCCGLARRSWERSAWTALRVGRVRLPREEALEIGVEVGHELLPARIRGRRGLGEQGQEVAS